MKQIARWHGFKLVIEKEYDPGAKGKRKTWDRVYFSWEGAAYLYPVDWFYNLGWHVHTMQEFVALLNKKKQEIESEGKASE